MVLSFSNVALKTCEASTLGQTASVHEVQLPAAMIADNLHDLNPIG
jgi:hypothetical protein